MKVTVTKVLALLIVTSIGLGGWYLTKKHPLPVEIISIEKNVEIKVFGLGTVEARILSRIGFKVSNPIVLINVDEGKRVNKGDILAKLDDAEQQARVAKAKAGVQTAQATLKGVKSSILKAEIVLTQKNRVNDRKQALYKKRAISADAVEAVELERDIAKADLAIAKSALHSANSSLETARAQLALEMVMLEQHILKAPYAGVIIRRHMELGTVVKTGEPLFTLVDPKSVWVLGHISESRSGPIAVGQVAQIRLRSRPHKLYVGKVERINVESDRVTEERQIYVSCDGCLEQFYLGEQAEVYITTAFIDNAILVPENAVNNFDERQMRGIVWVLEDGRLKKQNVIFGHRTLDARLSISHGLGEGDKVLKRLPKILQEGRSAKVSRENSL